MNERSFDHQKEDEMHDESEGKAYIGEEDIENGKVDKSSVENYVEVKAKKKAKRLNKLKNAWIEDNDKTTAKKKKKNKGNETSHNLLDETHTDNEFSSNTMSSQILKG